MGTEYALLVAPSANRVYTQSAPDLTRAELAAFSAGVLEGRLGPASPRDLGGQTYLVFATEEPLTSEGLAVLGNLSSGLALYELLPDDLLRPIRTPALDKFDDDLITIPKYSGKTNENFTKLLLNVTALASAWAGDFGSRTFTVLDPVAGRGTTLNQALMYGWNPIGIEIDGKDFEAYAAFLKTWLRRKRVKHRAEITPVRREGRRLGRRLDVELTSDGGNLTFFEADTTQARALMKRQVADLLVADLPYGVVHGSRTSKGLERGPAELLSAALPGWIELIRPGGAVGLSWNTHVAPREQAVELLERHGLAVLAPIGLEHWVDQGITRDVLVARRS
ncbi:SAM-dependent methyltransferase [Hamadaea sp. NPDC051192]|uniref:TRM11 family SAM-dependent methyltransferase n=1 Tax=Hamadaea sp. NPDC051192 TaxID=3154940 RepID=UPI003437ADE7